MERYYFINQEAYDKVTSIHYKDDLEKNGFSNIFELNKYLEEQNCDGEFSYPIRRFAEFDNLILKI